MKKSLSKFVWTSWLLAGPLSAQPAQVAATPIANPPGGNFTDAVSVGLTTATPGARIFVTLDGSTPDSNAAQYTASASIPLLGTATLKAIAWKSRWLASAVMTETFVKHFSGSILEILDAAGNPLADGYLTERDTALTVRVSTTEAGLAQLAVSFSAAASHDQENRSIKDPIPGSSALVYSSVVPFSAGKFPVAADGRCQASATDTLTVRWVNPRNSADTPTVRIPVRPAPKPAIAFFSSKADGSDTVDQFSGTETVLYLTVLTGAFPAWVAPTVTVEAMPPGSSGEKDVETVPLAAVVPGRYVAALPVDRIGSVVRGDGRLQLIGGTLLKGTFRNALDHLPPVFCSAGIGTAGEIDAALRFTDSHGSVFPVGSRYSPAEGALYLVYTDDWANGNIASKTVTLTIDNSVGKAGADTETFSLSYNAAKRFGTVGVWEGSLKLEDRPDVSARNGKAETYILGQVNAAVTSHDHLGAASTVVSDQLTVAYSQKAAVLSLEGQDGPGVPIQRQDSSVKAVLRGLNYSSGRDTLQAYLTCSESGDVVTLLLVEQVDVPGAYTAVIPKAEGQRTEDGILQCDAQDMIELAFTDPISGAKLESTALMTDGSGVRRMGGGLRFSPSASSIACFDARGAFLGAARSAGEGRWIFPKGRKVAVLRMTLRDGSTVYQSVFR